MAKRYELEESKNGNTKCKVCRNSIPKGSLMWNIGCFGFRHAENVNICAICVVETYKRNMSRKVLKNLKEEMEKRTTKDVTEVL